MRTYLIDQYNRSMYSPLLEQQHRLRNEIFVKRLGWDVPSHGGLESDQYDTLATAYAVTALDNGRVCAISRLIPTTEPYMIRDLWPTWSPERLPESPTVWEASRFGCCASLSQHDRRLAIGQLFRSIYTFCQNHGIERLMMVMPVFIFERSIKRLGYDVTYLGDIRIIDGLRTRLASVRIADAAASAPCDDLLATCPPPGC